VLAVETASDGRLWSGQPCAGGLLDHSPAAHIRRPRVDYESHATILDRNEVGALRVAAGLGEAAEHALISLLALNGLRVSEAATGADIEHLGLKRGHRILVITLHDVQEAASHAGPRTTVRCDRARASLDRHATCIVATYVARAAR